MKRESLLKKGPHPSIQPAQKTCSRCGKLLPATETYFARSSASDDGLRAWCKDCRTTVLQKLEPIAFQVDHQTVLIDAVSYTCVHQLPWRIYKNKVVASLRVGNSYKLVCLGNYLLNDTSGQEPLVYIDSNPLNNCKENLLIGKLCLRCKQYKRSKHFHNDKSKPDGLRSWCKECRKTKRK